jgi:hypothetical protein
MRGTFVAHPQTKLPNQNHTGIMHFQHPHLSEIRQNPAATATNFRLPTQANLPHPDVGSNRHGESIMFDRIHA